MRTTAAASENNPVAASGKRPRSIVFVTALLAAGGAERVLTSLANNWAGEGHSVTVVSLADTGQPPFFPFADNVSRKVLGLQGASSGPVQGVKRNVQRLQVLRRTIRELNPDVVISFLDRTNVLTLIATRGLGLPVIVSERTDPALRDIGRSWEILRRLVYPWASALVCQGQRPLNFFPARTGIKGCVIPNPVTLPPDVAGKDTGMPADGVLTIAALGSLRREKGFDILLAALAKLGARPGGWRLVVWGEGPLRGELEEQARALGIAGLVRFAGTTNEAWKKLAEADIFVLSSRVEGFPNALTEAMSVGLPVIATDVGAVPEIVRHGVDGIVVRPNDVDALTAALRELVDDPEKRRMLSGNAPQVLGRFSSETVMGMWNELIEKTGS